MAFLTTPDRHELRVVVGAQQVLAALPEVFAGKYAIFPVSEGDEPPLDLPSQVPSNIAAVVQTSGSTAKPKRVMLSAAAMQSSAKATEQILGPGQWLLSLPVNYVAGLMVLVRSYFAGTNPLVLKDFSEAAFFVAAESLLSLTRHTSLVPNQLQRLISYADKNPDENFHALLSGFSSILVGGQRIPASLQERADELGITLVTTYGSTETCGGCVYADRPLPGVSVRVLQGEIAIGGMVLGSGYLADESLTAERFVQIDGESWYLTGDNGSITDGLVRVTGRKDDVFISGGLKVRLSELNQFLQSLFGFATAIAVPIPDEKWGEVAAVAVDGRDLVEKIPLVKLRAQVSDALNSAAAPRILHYFDKGMPTLSSGKPDRVAITKILSEQPRY